MQKKTRTEDQQPSAKERGCFLKNFEEILSLFK